jgi:proline dehydrogenase
MSVFNRLLVGTLPLVPRFIVGRVAARYVAGATLDDALRVVGELNQRGAMATVDLLGEEVSERDKALAAVDEYLRVFAAIAERGLDSNVSIKLTLLGLKIDEGFCRDNVDRVAAAACARGNFVRIDMEDHTCTDATLRIYRELQARHGNLGVVLQAYMRRTLADVAELPRQGGNVRLCKGIYVEPRRIAWKGYQTVRRRHRADRQARPAARAVRVPDAARRGPGAARHPDRRRPPAARLRPVRPGLVPLLDPPPAREPRGGAPRPARPHRPPLTASGSVVPRFHFPH